jgi:hypothetical protein
MFVDKLLLGKAVSIEPEDEGAMQIMMKQRKRKSPRVKRRAMNQKKNHNIVVGTSRPLFVSVCLVLSSLSFADSFLTLMVFCCLQRSSFCC